MSEPLLTTLKSPCCEEFQVHESPRVDQQFPLKPVGVIRTRHCEWRSCRWFQPPDVTLSPQSLLKWGPTHHGVDINHSHGALLYSWPTESVTIMKVIVCIFGMGHYAAIDNQKHESKGRVIVGEWVLEIRLGVYWNLIMCFSGKKKMGPCKRSRAVSISFWLWIWSLSWACLHTVLIWQLHS